MDHNRLYEEVLVETEVDTFLKELPSFLKINNNEKDENNIPFRFVGMLGQAYSILRKIKFKEAVNLFGPFDSSLQRIVEVTTISLEGILPTIVTYHNKIQKHLDKIEKYIVRFGIPKSNLFTPTIFNAYLNFKKKIIVGLNQIKNAGLTDEECEQAETIMVETINSILKQIRRYYFWSLCSDKTRDEIKNQKILEHIVKTYTLTITNFELISISFD